MIPSAFEYHRPDSVAEAVRAFLDLEARGRRPAYMGGGTEILTRSRLEDVAVGAVVDLKGIPDCRILGRRDGNLVLGSALSLAEISGENPWPLFSLAAGRVADHTTRRQITLGGNIAGEIPYREAVLPLLLARTTARVAGPRGIREASFQDVFDGVLGLGPGEFLVQVSVPEEDVALPGTSVKRTRLDWVDYPLVTVAAQKRKGRVEVALSGVLSFPFRSRAVEAILNDGGGGLSDRIGRALRELPGAVLDDVHGSSAYRTFVLGHTLEDVLASL